MRTRTIVLGLLAALAGQAGRAEAVVFDVDTTVDAPDAAVGDGSCVAVGGGCSLRAALQEANASVGDDEIDVPGGTYLLSVAGTEEDAAATGDLDVEVVAAAGQVTIVGAGVDATILDGNGIDRVLDVYGDAVVKGVTIQGGAAATMNTAIGGGIYVEANGSLCSRTAASRATRRTSPAGS